MMAMYQDPENEEIPTTSEKSWWLTHYASKFLWEATNVPFAAVGTKNSSKTAVKIAKVVVEDGNNNNEEEVDEFW